MQYIPAQHNLYKDAGSRRFWPVLFTPLLVSGLKLTAGLHQDRDRTPQRILLCTPK